MVCICKHSILLYYGFVFPVSLTCLFTSLLSFVCSQPSFGKVVPPSFLDLGLAELVSIYNDLCQLGKRPPVIDATDLAQNPEVRESASCAWFTLKYHAHKKWNKGTLSMVFTFCGPLTVISEFFSQKYHWENFSRIKIILKPFLHILILHLLCGNCLFVYYMMLSTQLVYVQATLHSLCEDLGIPFQDSMLRFAEIFPLESYLFLLSLDCSW